jgi:hypothetical protein
MQPDRFDADSKVHTRRIGAVAALTAAFVFASPQPFPSASADQAFITICGVPGLKIPLAALGGETLGRKPLGEKLPAEKPGDKPSAGCHAAAALVREKNATARLKLPA